MVKRALLVVLLMSGSAAAQPADPPFWADVAHPERDRARSLIGEAIVHVRSQSFVQALPLLREATRLVTDDPLAWYLLGMAEGAGRRYPACAAALLETERLDPGFVPPPAVNGPTVPALLGECLALSGRIEEAAARFERAVRGAPAAAVDPQLLAALGDSYQALGRLEDAIDTYRRALAVKPQDPLLLFALGVALDRDEQLTRSREVLLTALRLDPPMLRLRAANVYFLPAEDLFYYLGLGHLTAWSENQQRDRRARAIVAFRRYQRDPSAATWRHRVQDHLARLGPATMGPDEIQLDGVAKLDAAARERMIAVVLRRGPELQACLASYPGVAMRTRVIVLGPRKDKTPPGRSIPLRRIPEAASSWVESVGADAPPEAAKTCLENLTRSLKFPAVDPGTRVQVTISVIAP